MLPPAEPLEHLVALAIIWLAALAPGAAICKLLPARTRRPGQALACWALVGGASWAIALYALPFAGGLKLWAAMALVSGVLAAVGILRRWSKSRSHQVLPRSRRRKSQRWVLVILICGAIPYVSPLFVQHVPPGMDASRYATAARLIAAKAGLPRDCSPFAPQVPFGAANYGVSALASSAVMVGVSPVSATLAAEQFCFAAVILGLYLLLGMFCPPVQAAVLSVACAYLGRCTQGDVSWGGFPGLLALALGMLAAWLLIQTIRRGNTGSAVVLGLCAGAMPLVHGAEAAAWAYLVAPLAMFVAIALSMRHRRRLVSGLARCIVSLLIATIIVTIYMGVAKPHFNANSSQWIIDNVMDVTFARGHGALVAQVAAYFFESAGRGLAFLALAAMAILVVHRKFRSLAVPVAGVIVTLVILADTRYRLVPGWALLYPERIRDLAVPICAITIGLGWRSLVRWRAPAAIRSFLARPVTIAACTIALMVGAFSQHMVFFQRTACAAEISHSQWAALRWAGRNLPQDAFVDALYGTAGAYLPAVAGVATVSWHVHVADQLEASDRMRATRPITHTLIIERSDIRGKIGRNGFDAYDAAMRRESYGARLIFQDGPVKLYALDKHPQ